MIFSVVNCVMQTLGSIDFFLSLTVEAISSISPSCILMYALVSVRYRIVFRSLISPIRVLISSRPVPSSNILFNNVGLALLAVILRTD